MDGCGYPGCRRRVALKLGEEELNRSALAFERGLARGFDTDAEGGGWADGGERRVVVLRSLVKRVWRGGGGGGAKWSNPGCAHAPALTSQWRSTESARQRLRAQPPSLSSWTTRSHAGEVVAA